MLCLDENSVIDYLEGWLPEETREEVERHIDGCPGCRALVSASIRDRGENTVEGYRLGDELTTGTRIDHFQVIRQLGRGSTGEVYLCRDVQLGRRVALKVVRPDALGSQKAIEQFLEEARTTARFSHPHIVAIHAAGVWRGLPYIALEYLEGETLRRRMERERPGTRQALRICLAVGQALREAHRHRVLHRDLKPANVILPRDGRLRVVDFSLAKVVSETEASGRGAVGEKDHKLVVCGTPTHMAPEQWRGNPATEAADVWALGVILYELLCGRRPYRGGSLKELRTKVTGPSPVPTLPGSERLPDSLVHLVMSCLDKDPAQRPTAGEVCDDLGRLVQAPAPEGAEGSPFRGLLPFHERHADLFFGREAEVVAFLERLREQGVLPVVGPSGAGKSSFVQAGVIPRLREQGRWLVMQLRPGPRPFEALAARLVRGESRSGGHGVAGLDPEQELAPEKDTLPARRSVVPDKDPLQAQRSLAHELADSPMRLNLALRALAAQHRCRVLLFVDQLEELVTLVEQSDTQERIQTSFVDALCGAGDEPGDPVRVIFTLRDDFLGRVALGPRVRETLGQMTIIRSPDAAALEEIVTRPPALRGYHYDDNALPGRMVAEVAGEPSALPLLQFATQSLWERRDRRKHALLRSVYDEIGGVAGALARHADSLLEGLPPQEVSLARQLLLSLVTPERTRRAVPREKLLFGLPDAAESVVERLTQGRLLSVRRALGEGDAGSSGELELAHESLLWGWSRLSRWIDESREELTQLAEMSQAAELWARRGEREQELWRGDALHEAQRTLARSTTVVPAQVQRFINAGCGQEERRARRRRLRLAGGMAALVAVAVAALVVAFTLSQQKRQAEEQRAQAQREGARAAMLRGDMLEARSKLRGSLETKDSALTRLLWRRLLRAPLHWKTALGAPLQSVAASPDGRLLAVASADRSLRLINSRTGTLEAVLRGHRDQVLSVAFSPDGRHLVSGSWDGEVWLWELDSRQGRRAQPDHGGAVWGAAIAANGALVATGSADRAVYLWRLRGGELQLERKLVGHTSGVYGVAFSPDGERLASGGYDHTVRVWGVSDGRQRRVLRGHTNTVYTVSFSPDGTRLASGSADRTAKIWAGDQVQHVLDGHTAGVARVRFSPDGAQLATASYDKSVRLWEVKSGEQSRLLTGHTAGVTGVVYGPGGKRLASVGRDRELRMWNLESPVADADRGAREGHSASIWGLSFSPDGRHVASASKDESLRVWEVATGRPVRTMEGHAGGATSVAFGPEGKRVASAGGDQAVRLFSLGGRVSPPQVLSGHTSEVYAVAFRPDGKWLASAGYDRTVRLWELRGTSSRQRHLLVGHTAAVYGLSFSPEGRLLASAGYDRGIRIWELGGTPRVARVLAGHRNTVYGVAFSPSGDRLASGSADGTVRLWSVKAGSGREIRRYRGRVYWLAFHPDGRRLGVPVSDGTARIVDLESGRETVLRGHRGEVNVVRFSPDGRVAATGADDGTVRLWAVEDGRPLWRAPALLPSPPRLLTHAGWSSLDKGGTARQTKEAVSGARLAAARPGGRWLCVATHDGHLEQWDLRADRRVYRRPGQADRLEVLPGGRGCLVLSGGIVTLHSAGAGSARRLEKGGATAMTVGGEPPEILVALREREVRVFSIDGAPRPRRFPADPGVTAMVVGRHWLVLGYTDGNVELVNAHTGERRRGFSLSDVPASQVERMLLGPMDTLIAGYASGLLGIWDLRTGSRLDSARLHGPVIHLLLERRRLFAASELGLHLSWDMKVLYASHCEVLQQVWRWVPTVWSEGRPVYREPPPHHRCAR
jgi:WD40 repeat protein